METIQPKHILIVDDSPEQRFLLKYLLESKGYTTESTSNGEEALILLRSRKDKPQTILLDMNMDTMDGFQFRKIQSADPSLRNIPVIVVSGEEDMKSIQIKMRSEVVKKPLSISSLMDVLKRNSRLH